jgi:hypothetical protein
MHVESSSESSSEPSWNILGTFFFEIHTTRPPIFLRTYSYLSILLSSFHLLHTLVTLPLSLPLSSLYSIAHKLISCLLTLPLSLPLSSLLFSSQELNLLPNSTPSNVLVIELDILAKKERKKNWSKERKKWSTLLSLHSHLQKYKLKNFWLIDNFCFPSSFIPSLLPYLLSSPLLPSLIL